MNLQNLTPFNWFRRDVEPGADYLPAERTSDPFTRMHREMDRMFDDFLGTARAGNGGGLLLRPSVDIAESKKAYRISVEVPGIDPEQVELQVQEGALVISGEKRQETEDDEEGFHRVERHYGQFRRVLALPEDADVDNIRADAKNGVLKIRIPRLKQADKPGARRIEISK